MIPLYGFLEGDSIGLLVLAYEEDTMEILREKLKRSASVRVSPKPGGQVMSNGTVLDLQLKLNMTSLAALDRIDVVWEKHS